MLQLPLAIALLSCFPASPAPTPSSAPSPILPAVDFEKLSPFQAVRQKGNDYEVLLDGEWFRLVSLDGRSSTSLREFCEKRYRDRAEKRFAEDLVEVLAGMGHKVGRQVDLELVHLSRGETLKKSKVPMTEENRQLVWMARNRKPGFGVAAASKRLPNAADAVPRIQREHSSDIAKDYAHLARPLTWQGWDAGPSLSREAAEQDLDQLEWCVQNTYSYRDLLGVQTQAAFDALRSGLQDKNPVGAFGTRLAQLLALYGDGHTRVRGVEALRPTGYLPFLLEATQAGVLALRADRSAFLDAEHPYLGAIDGKPLEFWLAQARLDGPRGSDAFVWRNSLRDLRLIQALRADLGLPLRSEVSVLLRNEAGEERTLQLPIADRKPIYGPWPRPSAHHVIDGDVGYLQVQSMDSGSAFLGELAEAMDTFRGTRGLVIDVRGNGGGSRDALRLLLPYFLDPKDGPRVVNVAAYRVPEGEAIEASRPYLENRYLYPAASSRWNEREVRAIEGVAHRFRPDWTPDPRHFSDWNYFVISAGGEYHYTEPVVVLMDGGCFSATDIFLGAFKGVPGVTLLGTPSGGGSGRSRRTTLANSGLDVQLSSMASFIANGSRYDGKGIAPDVLVLPEPGSFLSRGVDNQLEAALDRL